MSLRPVVLVHGVFATPGMMGWMRNQLRRAGHDVYLAPELSFGVVGDVRVHANQLAQTVARVRALTGVDKVDLVGASQGGVIGLWWAHQDAFAQVDRLVLVGSPIAGAPLVGWLGPLGGVLAGVGQLHPTGPFMAATRAIPVDRVVSVAVEGDPVCPPPACVLPGMRQRLVRLRPRWLAHQRMMLSRRVAAAIHEELVC